MERERWKADGKGEQQQQINICNKLFTLMRDFLTKQLPRSSSGLVDGWMDAIQGQGECSGSSLAGTVVMTCDASTRATAAHSL
jgi:hypothetical protein